MLLNTTTRTYELRTRARSGVAAQPSRDLDESPSLIDIDSVSNELATHPEGSVPNAEATNAIRSYSDVMASRPPSPRRERPVLPTESPMDSGNANTPEQPDNASYANDGNSSEEEDSSNREIETPDKPEYWTTVQRKCTYGKDYVQIKKSLTAEQSQTVKMAAEGLTKDQKEKILH